MIYKEEKRDLFSVPESNVFENKGNVNQHLIDWVNKNGYSVHFFDGFNYVSCGKGNAKTVEVFISNY